MVADYILEDWSDYDQEKNRRGISPNYFSCESIWEVDYLREKIKSVVGSSINDGNILNAIVLSSREIPIPRPRKQLVLQVVRRLECVSDLTLV